MTGDETTVLLVDEDRAAMARYAAWLAEAFAVRKVYDRAAALSAVDGGVDAVLVARRERGGWADDRVREIRARDDVPVAFLAEVAPDLDLVRLPVDEYLRTPVDERDLYQVVDTLLARGALDDARRASVAARTKVDLLADADRRQVQASHEAFIDLLETAARACPDANDGGRVAGPAGD